MNLRSGWETERNSMTIVTLKEIAEKTVSFEEKIKRLLRKFSIDDLFNLPRIELNDYDFCEDIPIPHRICCLYFLVHPVDGLLYIGKSTNLRERWRITRGEKYGAITKQHHVLERYDPPEHVFLCWYEIDRNLAELMEPILIRELNPEWNVHSKAKLK